MSTTDEGRVERARAFAGEWLTAKWGPGFNEAPPATIECMAAFASSEVAAVEAERDEAVAVLRSVEWDGSDVIDKCPVCGRSRNEGHSRTCRLAAAALKWKP